MENSDGTEIAGGGINFVGVPPQDFAACTAAGITSADVVKPVTLDTSANNTFKLAGAGDVIYGNKVVETVFKKVSWLVLSVQRRFQWTKSGVIAVGDSVMGAGAGAVKSGC